jgi:hypothetical protein
MKVISLSEAENFQINGNPVIGLDPRLSKFWDGKPEVDDFGRIHTVSKGVDYISYSGAYLGPFSSIEELTLHSDAMIQEDYDGELSK